MRVRVALGCCEAETDPVQRGVVLLPVARRAWLPRNVACNSLACISRFEIRSLIFCGFLDTYKK